MRKKLLFKEQVLKCTLISSNPVANLRMSCLFRDKSQKNDTRNKSANNYNKNGGEIN